MSDAIVAEFEQQLAALAAEHAGRPREELDALWAIGIEREAIVTVAYRERVIADRLARMPIDDEARAVVARAIRWAWRDEQAHTLWVRGAFLRRTDLAHRAVALKAQLEGLLGGWVSSRQNHLAWREAPVSRLVAEGLEVVGVASGRIPPAVREALHWNTFADFCRFNRAAETTAAMAWRRMAELAGSPEVASLEEAEGLVHMAADEERHAKIFAVLADAFGADDGLSVSAAELRERLQAVGQRFVAMPDAGRPAWRNPLGKGAPVVVRQSEDVRAAVGEVLEAIGMRALLAAATRDDHAPVVALKTSFMLIADRRDPSPAVSMAVLGAVVDWLREHGASTRVIDARNYYDEHRRRRTVPEVARYLGLDGEVVDAQLDQVDHAYARGMGIDTVSRAWRDADVRVLLGKLRSHPTATALLSLETAEGLGARIGEHLFAERRADRETAALMTIDAFPPHAALLDAWEHVPDGLLGVLGTRRPLQPRRVYGSTDAVALDVVAARHVGIDGPSREGTLVAQAIDWFGDPRARLRVDGIDAPIAGFRTPEHSAYTAALSSLALPVFTHASARGALFLPDFDEVAFPALTREPLPVRAARAAVRRVVADEARDRAERVPTTPAGELLATSSLDAPSAVRIARLGPRGVAGPGAHAPSGLLPVVMLHGYPETLQIWARVAPRLAARREVIAFDWPGLGRSAPVEGPADPDALAEHLRAVLDALGLARVDLVAADMGGPPALVFASRHPERVGTVVVTSSLLFGDEATSIEIAVMRRAGLADAAFRFAPGLVYARCKQSFLRDPSVLPEELDADFAAAFHQRSVRDRLAKMCAGYERALPSLPDRYWTLRRPVRLLWAEHDGHFPPAQAERLCALLPEARLVVVPGARHWMALSHAPEVAAHIERFLD
ncbi:MAG: alpha/beta fold hydrolase [Deltaproteobacteria bacterium]|nr:alpha/beta fold hydrolase [Deltaproteobacteria bacterium]